MIIIIKASTPESEQKSSFKVLSQSKKGNYKMKYDFTLKVLPKDCGGKECGGTNEIAFWSSTLPSGTTLSVQMERGGKTEFELLGPCEQDDTTLSKHSNSIHAAELAMTCLIELKEAIECWKQSYSPVSIKDDTIDYWHILNGEESTGELHIPWFQQLGGGESVNYYIGTMLGHRKGLEFTQTW